MAAVINKPLPTKLVSLPSEHLLCSICQSLYQEPVISVQCGHTFCRECLIKRGDKITSSCPIDNSILSIHELVLNRALVGQVEELSVYCGHGLLWSEEKQEYITDPTGCQEIVKIGVRREHEEECPCRLVPCPLGGTQCGMMRFRDVDSHRLLCRHQSCPHNYKGCQYAGQLADVSKHKETCGFRGYRYEEKSEPSNIIQELTKRVEVLENEKADMAKQLNQCLSLIGGLTEKYSNLKDEMDHVRRLHRSPSGPKGRPKSHSSFHRVPSSSSIGSGQQSIRIERWTMPFQFKCIGTLRGHSGSVFSLCLKGNILFSTGADSVIRTWHLDELRKGTRMIIKGHRDAITAMAASDESLFSASRDMSIRSWNPDDGTQKCIVENAHENEMAAMVSNDDHIFTSSISEIKVWDASTLKHVHTISGLHHVVRALALNASKQDKLYSGSHNTIEIWDAVHKFNLKGKIDHKFGSVHSLAVNNKYIFAGTYNRNIHLYDTQTQLHSQSLSGHFGSVTSLSISPSGRFLFSASSDATIKIWNLETMLPIQTLIRHEAAVHSIVLQGDLLLSGSEDNDVKVYMYYNL